ncbi:MAG: hypothetical protein ACLP5E_02145 [Streptosporangiaceae bacterium]
MRLATDKVTLGYLPAYLRIAAELGTGARVCEVGVQHGHGLDMFQALFPGGLVAGVDRDPGCRWPGGTVAVICAQDAADLAARLAVWSPAWDLIADDASHDGTLTRATLDLLWPLVAPGGFYVIEDWQIGLPSWRLHGDGHDYGDGMLQMAASLLPLLDRGGDADEITYRYGLVILRKKKKAAA